MTPTVPELLLGNMICLSDPPPPESMGDFLTSRVVITGMIAMLCAQEAEGGVAARVWENGAIRDLLNTGAQRHGGAFAQAAAVEDGDLTLTSLDRVNAGLRRSLISLHEAVEAAQDTALHHDILRLYLAMAQARRLDLPAAPAA